MKDLVSIRDMTVGEVESLINLTKRVEDDPKAFSGLLKDKSLAIVFFQSSTRTRLGFSLAMQRLGGSVVEVQEEKKSYSSESVDPPESFGDTMRVIGDYVDLVCLRSRDEFSSLKACESSSAAIVNCGNGYDEHPTQSLIDLYTIAKECKRFDNLNVLFVGDLKRMRSSHSLFLFLSSFASNKITLVSPDHLKLPATYWERKGPASVFESEDFDVRGFDVVYMAGLPTISSEDTDWKKYRLDKSKMLELEKDAIVLNPLPRINEIAKEVDVFPHAKYFDQSKSGLYVRMALLLSLLAPEGSLS